MAATEMRVVVVAAWIGLLVALASWGDSTPATVCAVAATVATGLLVGRWWVLLVPTGPALVLIVYYLFSEQDPGEWWDADPSDYALGLTFVWIFVVGLLAIGVAIHKLVARMHPRARVS
jgi:hypothetical protein